MVFNQASDALVGGWNNPRGNHLRRVMLTREPFDGTCMDVQEDTFFAWFEMSDHNAHTRGSVYHQAFPAMKSKREIELEFADRAITRGSVRLYRPLDAVDLIRRYRDADLPVLGVDAFTLEGDAVRPSMANGIDYSADLNRHLLENSWDHAERFVREYESTPLLFEISVEAENS